MGQRGRAAVGGKTDGVPQALVSLAARTPASELFP